MTEQFEYLNKLNDYFESLDGNLDYEEYAYTEEDYKKLEKNLKLFKEGNREATEYIIKVFHPFLRKYALFICNHQVPYSIRKDRKGNVYKAISKTITLFVGLYVKGEERKEAEKYKRTWKTMFSATCAKIYALYSKFEIEDIYNELALALINMANKYKIREPGDPKYKPNGTFHMYVMKAFHFEAHSFLSKLVKDPLVHNETLQFLEQPHHEEIIEIEENTYYSTDEDKNSSFEFEKANLRIERFHEIKNTNHLTIREDIDPMNSDEAMNFNWTNGVTCSEIFKELTSYEREILALRYVKNVSVASIAKIYDIHRSTMNKHINEAVKKITPAVKNKRLIS